MDEELRAGLVRRWLQRMTAQGSIVVPAVPSMLEEYVVMCDRVFRGLGVTFTEEQLEHLRGVLRTQLDEAFAASPRSEIVITYDSPAGQTVNYHVKAQWSSVEMAYDTWVATREPPLFGIAPDARVMALAGTAPDPRAFSVLDLGAGTGRNALALARAGHPVDAVEATPAFAQALREAAKSEGCEVRVIERDIFAVGDDLRTDYQLIVLSEVTSDFRSADQLRQACELADRCLAPGGILLMNLFLPRDRYAPDAAARELGQQCYTSLFTREELARALAGLSLTVESEESVHDYERAALPPEAWPPTGWYERWVRGQDLFDVEPAASPVELRWLALRKLDEWESGRPNP